MSSLGVLTEFGSVKDEGEFNGNTMASGGVATVPVEVVCPEEGCIRCNRNLVQSERQ